MFATTEFQQRHFFHDWSLTICLPYPFPGNILSVYLERSVGILTETYKQTIVRHTIEIMHLQLHVGHLLARCLISFFLTLTHIVEPLQFIADGSLSGIEFVKGYIVSLE